MSPPKNDGLLQMLHQNDTKHDEKHQRLRLEYRELEERISSIARRVEDQTLAIDRIDKRPVDLSKGVLTPSVVLTIVMLCLSIAGGMYASTYGLRSDVRDILTRAEAQSKLTEERSDTLTKAIDEMRRRVELQQYEIQSLKDVLIKPGQQGAKR